MKQIGGCISVFIGGFLLHMGFKVVFFIIKELRREHIVGLLNIFGVGC